MSLSTGDGIVSGTPSDELDEYEASPLITDEDEEEIHAEEVASWKKRPWWKRPSPYWLVSATFAPRVEVYTLLVCHTLKPEYFPDSPIYPVLPHIVGAVSTQNASATHANESSYLSSPIVTYPSTIPGYEEDEQTRQKCTSDPAVQAVVAKLSATLTTTMGILSCLVTGWWANFSDRYGRRPVFVASMVGIILVDLTFIITANFVDYLPGGYWFLLVGFVMDGLLGSTPTAVAVNHAYLADTCEPSARSRIFAFALGLTFTGFAVGPLLGGFLIHLTGSTLSVFFMAFSIHLGYALVLLFVLPESLTEAKARAARLRYKQEKERNTNIPTLRRVFKEATRFLSALAVLLPRDIIDADPLKRSKKDWNLFLLAISYAFSTSLMALMPFLIQYAIGVFRWSAETANYYFSLIGITRAVVLTVILPLMIKLLKSRKALTSHTRFPETRSLEPHLSSQSLSPLGSRSRSHQRFDATISSVARCAVSLEILACWVMATCYNWRLGAMSVASSPTIQALAVEVYYSEGSNGGGIGKLFGALSVLQALGAQIIAPAVYGFIYSRTVATFPQAILLVTAFCFTAALVLLACVRIPTSSSGLVQSSRDTEEGRSEGRNEDSTEGVLVDVAVEAHE
ncbi:major facilitator superfamily domain-containing protein [Pisolithus thermaeus]|nr:major facilitator superfamily domain-containing protein [Pisolithus thermaeus]